MISPNTSSYMLVNYRNQPLLVYKNSPFYQKMLWEVMYMLLSSSVPHPVPGDVYNLCHSQTNLSLSREPNKPVKEIDANVR